MLRQLRRDNGLRHQAKYVVPEPHKLVNDLRLSPHYRSNRILRRCRLNKTYSKECRFIGSFLQVSFLLMQAWNIKSLFKVVKIRQHIETH